MDEEVQDSGGNREQPAHTDRPLDASFENHESARPKGAHEEYERTFWPSGGGEANPALRLDCSGTPE